ncbi:peptide ABC transporter substrate-binding protein [Rhizohabitans arisaemae]|uniref:peptide ABC transporter substrate-binding protein n=1 Tax=Rhizohabitans arisaemae TaxID=2720610 RepID=UPI0024B1DFFC|nr:ABC transporter substrate-binding protein [Rhizohabitans arisaemae]
MRVRKGVQLVAGAALLSMVAAACGGGDVGATKTEGPAAGTGARADGTVFIRGCEPQNPIVPGNINETCGGKVADALFTGLREYNPDTAQPEDAMAESIQTTDNKTFTIKIKQGWKFHDGTEVKAKNFVDAWNFTAYSPNAQLGSYWFADVKGYDKVSTTDPDGEEGPKKAPTPATDKLEGLKVVDDYTFTVELKAPQAIWPFKVGYTTFSPLPDAFFSSTPAEFGKKPVGNGPFKFESWQNNVQITVATNADYPGERKSKVKKIVYKMYQDDNAAYADLISNNLDFLEVVPPSALTGDKWKTDLGDRAISGEQGVIQTLTFPLYNKEFGGNADFRKAISLSIDRVTITDKIFNKGRVPVDGWSIPLVNGYKAGACAGFCTFDPAKAKEHLAKSKAAGYNPPAEYPLWYNGDSAHKEWTEAACNSINQALEVKWCVARPMPTFDELRDAVTSRKIKGMFRTGWQMDYPHLENFLTPLYETGASSNDGEYSNKEFDAKLDQADQTTDPTAATTLYQEAEALLAEDLPAIPLWYYGLQAGYSTHVKNVKVTPFGELDPTSIEIK